MAGGSPRTKQRTGHSDCTRARDTMFCGRALLCSDALRAYRLCSAAHLTSALALIGLTLALLSLAVPSPGPRLYAPLGAFLSRFRCLPSLRA